ncbi:hypothetical protein B9J08_01073 [Candidozyma auris]|uniref:Rap-GAP domain-containing protein n=1 Tax=Candidozyma auris TaxID=498019 RepID=A0A2H0ZLU9_CANAR|nr:hypothetical protein B9J08_003212 [[Candida] auris]
MSDPNATKPRATSGFGSVLKSITRSLKPASGNVPVVINAKVVGGGADMQNLLLQLQQGSVSSRAHVAFQITEALEKYSLSSIPEVWYLARDLCNPQNQSTVRRAALNLLIQCIRQDEDAVSNKLMFYTDIVKFCVISESKVDDEFDLFLKALQALTNDGRDIHDLYIYEQNKSFSSFLLSGFKVLSSRAKNYVGEEERSFSIDVTFHNLVNLTNFMTNCIQFNYSLSGDHMITSVLDCIVNSICCTSNSTIISSYLNFIKYSVVLISSSDEVYPSVVRVLCFIFASHPHLKDTAATIIQQCCVDSFEVVIHTLGSVINHAAPDIYSTIDSETTLSPSKSRLDENAQNIAASLGAISVLEHVFNQIASEKKMTDVYFAIDQAYDSITDSLETKSDLINSAFLSMFSRLFDVEDRPQSITKQTKFAKLFPYYSWYSASRSVFNLLHYMDIRSEQDSENWTSICDSLLSRYQQEDLLAPQDALVELFMLHPNSISDKVTAFTLEYFREEKLCSSASRKVSLASEKSDLRSKAPSEILFVPLSKTLSKFLITSACSDPKAAVECYNYIIKLLKNCLQEVLISPSLALLRSLVRIRVTNQGFVYFTDVTDMGGLANAFKRSSSDPNFDKDKKTFWEYPETMEYIPKHNLDKFTVIKVREPENSNEMKMAEELITLDISLWFDLVNTVITDFYHWEIYSFVWAHYCSQVSNMALFENHEDHILGLLKVVNDQLMLHLPRGHNFPTEHTSVAKSDLQVALIRMLSSLIGYHRSFSKADEDQLINAVIYAMGSYERTAIPCIHILNICCYEIPLSIKKFLTTILTRLQTSVTSSFASPPTLEFMMSLTNQPLLTSSLTTDDYKRFFAIAFKYIQYSSILRSKMAQSEGRNVNVDILQQHGVEAEVEKKASTQITPITPIMNEYLSLLSYKLIARLFLTISLSERRKLSPFLMRNLVAANQDDATAVKHEPIIAFADFIVRFVCSDIPLKVISPPKSSGDKQNELTNSWILGTSIMTITTNTIDGNSKITIRRPTSVSVLNLQLDHSMLQTTMQSNGSKRLVLNSYFLLQLVDLLDVDKQVKPIPLLDDAVTERAIGALDRIPVVSFHKAGIIYIGPNQKDEKDIFDNNTGSISYHRFLDHLGKLIKLQESDSVYVGGLDKEGGSDGKYAYISSDTISQTVFHVTTLMPNVATDKYHALKKRHIGNNHVNIFFDESGHAFNFNVIKSQFNFLNIVITPHTALQRTGRYAESKVFKVKTFRRHGVPGIFSTTHFKLISAEQLPSFIRNTILISDKFAQIWHNCNNGEYISNWQLRVRQIESLRSKTMQMHKVNQEEQEKKGQEKANTTDSGGIGHGADAISSDMTASFLEQLQGAVGDHEQEDLAHTSNFRYEYVAGDDHHAYQCLEFGSYI